VLGPLGGFASGRLADKSEAIIWTVLHDISRSAVRAPCSNAAGAAAPQPVRDRSRRCTTQVDYVRLERGRYVLVHFG
jgi:hypothetical protein